MSRVSEMQNLIAERRKRLFPEWNPPSQDSGSTAVSEPEPSPGSPPPIESAEWRSDSEARGAWSIPTDCAFEIMTCGGLPASPTIRYY